MVGSQLWGEMCKRVDWGVYTSGVGGMDDIPPNTPAIQTAMQLRLPLAQKSRVILFCLSFRIYYFSHLYKTCSHFNSQASELLQDNAAL